MKIIKKYLLALSMLVFYFIMVFSILIISSKFPIIHPLILLFIALILAPLLVMGGLCLLIERKMGKDFLKDLFFSIIVLVILVFISMFLIALGSAFL